MFSLRPFFLLVVFLSPAQSIRSFPGSVGVDVDGSVEFYEAPEYRNGVGCPQVSRNDMLLACDPLLVHVAMTLDLKYLRGSVAAVHSLLKHSSCPENIFFHFVAANSSSDLAPTVRSTFPSLRFKLYSFQENLVNNLISSSIRHALENPLNYARSYLAHMLEPCINRVIYLDSDIVVVDDIHKLWSISLSGSRVIGAPEYCHVNFTNYFSDEFWFHPEFSRVFDGKRPCYFNTGVMVMDLARWRAGDYTRKIEKWMEIQKERRIYDLGSLPPFLLVFGGEVEGIDHRWNQHGLGGDNVVSSCRSLHPGPVSLLHWSGKEKPWVRLDSRRPCPVDSLWAPYDLYNHDHHRPQSPQEREDRYSTISLSFI